MGLDNDDLVYDKYICNDCGKVVTAHTFEDVIKYEKKCADCRVIDVTGGFKHKHSKKVFVNNTKKPYNPSMSLDATNPTNLRRDIKEIKKHKHTKVVSHKQKLISKQREEEKWDRIRAGWKSFDQSNSEEY